MNIFIRNFISGYLATKSVNFALTNFKTSSPATRGALYGLGVWSASRLATTLTGHSSLKKWLGPFSMASLVGHIAVGAALVSADEKVRGFASQKGLGFGRHKGTEKRLIENSETEHLRRNYLTPPSDFDETRNRSGLTH